MFYYQSPLILATSEKWCFEHLLSWTIALIFNTHIGARFPHSQISYKLVLNQIMILRFQSSVVTFNIQLPCEIMTLADGSRYSWEDAFVSIIVTYFSVENIFSIFQ